MTPKNLILCLLSILLFSSCSSRSISEDEALRAISTEVSCSGTLMDNLLYITENAPARMSGSSSNAKAVDYFYSTLTSYGLDSVWKQEVKVINWIPGESIVFLNLPEKGRQYFTAVPLGTSAGTKKNITAPVVEVRSREELAKANVKGKIVFFNMVMDSVNNYSVAGWQRKEGPSAASKKGALAAIVRSVTEATDNNPHTGVTRFEDGVKPIPAIAISTVSANGLSKAIKRNPDRKLTVYCTSKTLDDAYGNNVVAEIRGQKNPENIILVSAHIDSWFNSQGANDNATGCVQAMEMLRVFKNLEKEGIHPANTIRILLYQDEEMYMSGFNEYARIAFEKGEKHLFDIELDSGAGRPGRFILCTGDSVAAKFNAEILPALSSQYGLEPFIAAGTSKSWPLSSQNVPVGFYRADTENYFNLHHSPLDNIDTIDPDQIAESAAAITSFIYLMDKKWSSLNK